MVSDKNIKLMGENISFQSEEYKRLLSISKLKGVYKHVVGLPDLHYKQGAYGPTGIAVATSKCIIPKLVGANCGMSILKTPLVEKEITLQLCDDIFVPAMSKISAHMRHKSTINSQELDSILLDGLGWMHNERAYPKCNGLNTELNGNALSSSQFSNHELLSMIPSYIRKIGLLSMGILPLGNHFIEMQAVDKIYDSKKAEAYGLRKGDVVFMFHTDSALFGKTVNEYYLHKLRETESIRYWYKRAYYGAYFIRGEQPTFEKTFLKSFHKQMLRSYWKASSKHKAVRRLSTGNLHTVRADSPNAQHYLAAGSMVTNYGFVNRAVLMDIFTDIISQRYRSCKTDVLYDCNHDSISKETLNDQEVWIHRNGSNKAYPRHYYRSHPVFSSAGQPLIVPGSMGTASFICSSLGNQEALYSANHGAGRSIDRIDTLSHFKEKDVLSYMDTHHIRLYRLGEGNIVEEAPQSYKNIDRIITLMSRFKLAEPVVKLKPLAVLKGS